MRHLGSTHGKCWQNWSQTTSHNPPRPHVHPVSWEQLGGKTTYSFGILIPISCTLESMALKQEHWSNISAPEELRLTRIVVLPSMNSTKTCRTCSCVFVVLKFVLHVPSAFCTKPHRERDYLYCTHIIALITQSSWTSSSSAPANQRKVSSWTGREQMNQARRREEIQKLIALKWHWQFISCWVQVKKKHHNSWYYQLAGGFSHVSASSAKFSGANHRDLFDCALV